MVTGICVSRQTSHIVQIKSSMDPFGRFSAMFNKRKLVLLPVCVSVHEIPSAKGSAIIGKNLLFPLKVK